MDTRKKLYIYIPRMGSGGAERVASILANSLSIKYRVKIITLVSGESFYQLSENVELISAGYSINRRTKLSRIISMGKYFCNAVRFVRHSIKFDKPDIVFSLLPQMDVVVAIASIGCHEAKVICSERGDPNYRGKLMQHVINHIYRKCDMLVCQNEAMMDYYDIVSVNKKRIIPNPVDFSKYPERIAEGNKKRIVGVGRLREMKNFQLLIDSFKEIAVRFPDVNLTIYGEGPERPALERRIIEQGLQHRVSLPGVTNTLLLDIRDAALFVMSSNFEGFPNALIEAIAMGIPVVSTDFPTGVAREVVQDDVGLVVPCGDKTAMVNALKSLLGDAEKRQHIRSSGYKHILRFDTGKVVEMWETTIEELLQ